MKKILLLTMFIMFNTSFAQEYKLGKVTIEELKETEHKIEKEATACKIFSKSKTSIVYNDEKGFELVTEVENKIKIYKTEGLKYADFAVNIRNQNSDKETISFSEANTYNLVNNKIEKTKLKSDGEFIEKVNKFYTLKKIAMPNVKVGSVIEYKYTLKSPFLSAPNAWEFQELIPVNFSQYQFSYPEYYSYNPFYKGELNVKTTKRSESKTVTRLNKERVETGRHRVETNFSESKFTYNEQIINYEIFNVPSVKEEFYVKNISNYVTGISHELVAVKYPNETIKLFSSTWEEVAKTINSSADFGGELNKKGYYEEQINTVVSGKTSSEDKLNAVYDYVKNTYKWNGYYGIWSDEGLRSIYKNKTGNVADINLSLVAFLRHAGLNAHPVLISSVSNGIPTFPSINAFNYVIAGVELNGKTILLDATDKYAVPNVLPARAINWIGRIIYQNGGSQEVDLEPSTISKDNVILSYSITTDGKALGSLKRQLTDHNAYSYRNKYGQSTKEALVENRENHFKNIEIENYISENMNALNLPVIESFDFVDDKHIEVIGNKIYFSPLLFLGSESNPFKSENRAFPIEFPFPSSDRYAVAIAIPDGYEIEFIPESESLSFNDNLLAHKYIFKSDGKSVKLMLQDEVNVSILSADNYQNLKEYFQKKVEKQSDKIILKKK
ncbi:DUF3857 domain-containing protein [Flavobacterium ardleyense]|uniref:DUF3857 domain-containing protein n=1 Tax=Flavobacterium ardleyense TaxID=2038737 RepID=A0ABW5Z5U3_9FLAO